MRYWTALAALAAAAAPSAAKAETAILAGGCYWGVEAVFEHVRGVNDVVSGFAGEAPGRAEAVRIDFDPAKISYSDLLRIYFTVAHDPGQLNRQGPDVGPMYRSAIFPQSAAQRATALRAITSLKASNRKVVTRIENGGFLLAPAYHQDFMKKNPRHPYVLAHDVPKLAALKRVFPAFYR
jgi:peptide-methionine (S)-S-oxide reductase